MSYCQRGCQALGSWTEDSLQLRAPAVLGPPPAPPKANVGWGVLWTWGVLCSGQGWAASGHQDLPVLGGNFVPEPSL